MYKLCSKCGAIDKDNLVGKMCGCGEENYIKLLKVDSKEGLVHKCPLCKSERLVGWRVFSQRAINRVKTQEQAYLKANTSERMSGGPYQQRILS